MNNALKADLDRRGLRLIDLARLIGVNKSTVTRWLHGRIPVERALDIERVLGTPRHDLRPDVFGPAPIPTIPQPPAPEQVQLQDNCA